MVSKTWITTILLFLPLMVAERVNAQSDLGVSNYGPSRGRRPAEYATQINNYTNGNNLSYAKFYAEKALAYFLDDACPLPKNLVGDFKDDRGMDALSMYRGNEGCDRLMLAFFNLYKKYPTDPFCAELLPKVIAFADCMLQYGTDRYGPEHSPLLASILIRGVEEGVDPYVPYDPDNPNNAVRIELRSVHSYDTGGNSNNYVAIGIGNIWYGSDESHKSCWRGADLEASNGLYTLLYALSKDLDPAHYPDKNKYKKAADASLAFWMRRCQTESKLFAWGEHLGYNFYAEHYSDDYYHAPFHEYKGGFIDNLDKMIENQARVAPDEMTAFEEYAAALRPTHTASAEYGARYGTTLLTGMFLFCRHGTAWTDRVTARNNPYPVAAALTEDVATSFGNFPGHIGAQLHVMALAYNRASKTFVRDVLAEDMHFYLDGIEKQRAVYANGAYYPYGEFIWWNGTPASISNAQNGTLGDFAKRAAALMEGLDEDIKNKLEIVAKVTNTSTNYAAPKWLGPQQATAITPLNGFTLFGTTAFDLSWSSSEEAAKYQVYFSKNKGEVANATPDSLAFRGELTDTSCPVSGLDLDETYYWAIDALDENGNLTKGDIMTFKTSSGTPVLITAIQADPIELETGSSLPVVYSLLPTDASNPFVLMTTEDPSIASVSEGNIKGLRKGNTKLIIKAAESDVSIECPVVVKALHQTITFDLPAVFDASASSLMQLEATASSGLPVKYEILSGNASLLGASSVFADRSGYINGSIITVQDLIRLKVEGMDALFHFNPAEASIPQAFEYALFKYATIVDGHRRNFDLKVNMAEYANNWAANSSVPALLKSPVSGTIIQPKIPAQSTFSTEAEYRAAYQKMLEIDITDFIKEKISNQALDFTIALQANRTNSADGEDYVRIASASYSDENLRPQLFLYEADEAGSLLKFNSNTTVIVRVTQEGDEQFDAAESVSKTITVTGLTGFKYPVQRSVRYYPNPVVDYLTIETGNGWVKKVTVFDISSRMITSVQTQENDVIIIPMKDYVQGIYTLCIETSNERMIYKLIKK